MQLRFAFFTLACLSGAIYLAASQGASNIATLAVGAMAIGGIVAARLSAAPARKRSEHSVSSPRTRAIQEQASTLAANLDALADARAGIGPELAGREQLTAYLASAGRNRIAVIKALRSHFNIGLKEAKQLTDEATRGERPLLARNVAAETARALARDVTAAGGRVDVE